ncbi:MAG: family 20 glycosylhydrolase [Sedimentisphaerales bacterium]|nr:family 20 glycosylhydrolase [Sedimentisphaerales bacterium]
MNSSKMETGSNAKKIQRLLIPVKKVVFGKGFFRLSAQSILTSSSWVDRLPLIQLAMNYSQLNLQVRITDVISAQAALKIHRDKRINNREAYRLIIDQTGISIYTSSNAGAYYALQTLGELLKIYGSVLPLCRIEDSPDFQRRGVYYDCSRGKVPRLATLKELVKRLAGWKINELQLYIENVFTFKQHPEIGKGYSPFTPEEILSLQDYCRMHHIRLVGSLASFGHLEKILALPQYRHLGELCGFRDFQGGTTLCPLDPGSSKLITELYNEFLPLFDADDFNVCCDETWELGKGRSKSRAERIGTGRIYLNFLLKIYRMCEYHGKRMNIWADILLKYPELLSELPKDIVLLNWEYEQDGANIAKTRQIAESGLAFMVCPGTSSWLTHGSRMPNSMANVTNFAEQGRKFHAEGLLNTDWGDNGHRNFLGVSLHGFAHAAAHAWNGRDVDDKKFTDNFCFHVFGQKDNLMAKSLKMLGSNYLRCGCTARNRSLLHEALVEPINKPNKQSPSPIDMMTEKGLSKIASQPPSRKLWPKIDKSLEKFESLALEELELAERMDCIAARRALAVKALRAGEKVNSSELERLSHQMSKIIKDFKRLWLERNKISRLKDNLILFSKTQKQLSRLAKKS